VIAARSPLYAHHVPPHEINSSERTRYLDQGIQEFRIWLVPHEGDWHTANLAELSERLHRPLIAHHESSHGGDLSRKLWNADVRGENISIGAIKFAEDGEGMIVRAVESNGKNSSATFRMGTSEWSAEFHPFEIKSWYVLGKDIREVDFLERAL